MLKPGQNRNSSMLETFSKRLRFCRTVTELTANDIIEYVKKSGGKISVSGYAYWERTKDGIFPKKSGIEIEIITSLFNQRGLAVTSEWILYGHGKPPTMPWPGSVDDAELFNYCGEILTHSKNWKIIQVAGSYGEPAILIGETLLISEVEDFSSLHGKMGLLIDTSHLRYAGIIDIVNQNTIKIINNNSTLFEKDKIMNIYKIHWVRKV
jgi:predicted Rdx family selenoprotein